MYALAACRLQLGFDGRTYSDEVVRQFDTWREPGATWTGKLTLSDGYYSEILEHGVPLDTRAVNALSGSSMALDLYYWLAHRLHRIEGKPQFLHWNNLLEQFGQEYTGKYRAKNFANKFLIALEDVKAVYPRADVKVVEAGLRLCASPPPIAAFSHTLAAGTPSSRVPESATEGEYRRSAGVPAGRGGVVCARGRPFESGPAPAGALVEGAVERVFTHWRQMYGYSKAVLDAKRRRVITEALGMYSEADLCLSITGYQSSPHHMGHNERATVYDDIELFLRDAQHIDAGLRFASQRPRADLTTVTRGNIAAAEEARRRLFGER